MSLLATGFMLGGASLTSRARATGEFPGLSTAEWREDVGYLVETLEKVHPDPYSRISREEFLRESKALAEAIPSLDSAGIAIRLMQLVARIEDGHTSLDPLGVESLGKWYPIRFYHFSDGIFITAIGRQHGLYAGTEVLRIGNLSAQEAWDLSASLAGGDNRLGSLERAPVHLSNAGALRALGVTDTDGPLSLLVRRNGSEPERVIIPPIESGFDSSFQYWGETWGPASSETEYVTAFGGRAPKDFYDESSELPMHLRYRSAFWSKYEKTSKLFYIQINYMGDSGRRNQTFDEFNDSVWAAVDAADVERLVIDLRYNVGGDGSLVNRFVHEVIKRDSINRRGRLFVILGRATFSAGVMLAHGLDEHTEATFVGEPPGAYYRHFGDSTSFKLPHSGFEVWVSTIYHQLSSYVGDTRIMPIEYPAQFSSADYFGGRDPALQTIRDIGSQPPLAQIFREQGGPAGVAEYEKRAKAMGELEWWAPFSLDELDHLGDEFREAERWDDAIATYSLNTRRHPGHWRVWYSLGDLYRVKGDRGKAVQSFQRALEVDPFNNLADLQRAHIEELKAD